MTELNFDDLLELQSVDLERDAIRHEMHEISNSADVKELESKLNRVSADAVELKSNHDLLALKIEQIEISSMKIKSKIDELNDRLYKQEGLGSKELQVVAKEVEHQKVLLGGLEDEELNLLDQFEALQKILADNQDNKRVIMDQLNSIKRNLSEQLEKLTSSLDELNRKYASMEQNIDHDILETYLKLRGSGKQVAVGKLITNKCTGCSVDIAQAEVNRIKTAKDQLNFCEQCGCILAF